MRRASFLLSFTSGTLVLVFVCFVSLWLRSRVLVKADMMDAGLKYLALVGSFSLAFFSTVKFGVGP